MSRTNKHIKMRKLKTKIINRKKELGIENSVTQLSLPISAFGDSEIMNLYHEFSSGSLRSGNERKMEARMKVKGRKTKRAKLKKGVFEDLKLYLRGE